ncbi:MAG: hypothetical protein IJ693_11665 [Bacteroidaceae bacterium]|nr:hypothetical protein [Bacteroidaceae bacterium]
MANNKRKDLGIGTFIDEVKADSTGTQRISAPETQPEAYVQQPVQPQMTYQPVGRPARKQSLLSKKLAKLVYIDDETEMQLKLIKTFQNFDYKEVIFTAIHEFMEHHYKDMRLDESGAKKVEKIIREYKTRS